MRQAPRPFISGEIESRSALKSNILYYSAPQLNEKLKSVCKCERGRGNECVCGQPDGGANGCCNMGVSARARCELVSRGCRVVAGLHVTAAM